jgi:hypothetical protein
MNAQKARALVSAAKEQAFASGELTSATAVPHAQP